jgi:uncharacterized membrane protein YGL010W
VGVLAVIFLVTHVLTEVGAHRIGPVGVAVPFVTTSLYLSLGPVAAYLMLVAMWTGLVRARFAGAGRPWLWRVLHTIGYVCWPVALLHGLHAGRKPAMWVTASYLLLLILVTIAVGLRLAAERRSRRNRAARVLPRLRYGALLSPAVSAHGAWEAPGPALAYSFSAPPVVTEPVAAGAAAGRRLALERAPEPGSGWRALPRPGEPTLPGGTPPREQLGIADLRTVVDLDPRRKARQGGALASPRRREADILDEADERYLAALRGEVQ